jgi:hypothetical protein
MPQINKHIKKRFLLAKTNILSKTDSSKKIFLLYFNTFLNIYMVVFQHHFQYTILFLV